MLYGLDVDPVLLNSKEHCVWELPEQSSTILVVEGRKLHRHRGEPFDQDVEFL